MIIRKIVGKAGRRRNFKKASPLLSFFDTILIATLGSFGIASKIDQTKVEYFPLTAFVLFLPQI